MQQGAAGSNSFQSFGVEVKVCSITACVAQSAWVQNGTVEENILFGLLMHWELYKEVIRVCCLEKDMEMMEFDEQKKIGESGINLSAARSSASSSPAPSTRTATSTSSMTSSAPSTRTPTVRSSRSSSSIQKLMVKIRPCRSKLLLICRKFTAKKYFPVFAYQECIWGDELHFDDVGTVRIDG